MINITGIERKKEYLQSYLKQCEELKSLKEQMASVRETITSAKSQKYDDMPHYSKKTDLSDQMVKLDKLTKEIEAIYKKCLWSKIKVESDILNMKPGIERTILHKKYILDKTFDEIAAETEYCTRHLYRLHGRALQIFKIGGSDDKK